MRSITALLILLAAAATLGCLEGPEVFQGSVTAVDVNAATLTAVDGGVEMTFAIGEAEIGARPEIGDVVRIAYRQTDEVNVASRVMNVTRQEGGSSSGGH